MSDWRILFLFAAFIACVWFSLPWFITKFDSVVDETENK
jgi:hypothetical protein